MGLDSIIFHTKYFEQKLVLTCFTHVTMETWPSQYENFKVSRVLDDDYFKRLARVTVGVAR